MSLGGASAKFHSQELGGTAIPPSPTRENPAAVYPKASPNPSNAQDVPGAGRAPSHPRSTFSNPYAFDESLAKLENALGDVIGAISDEERSGISEEEENLLKKFKSWKNEVDMIRGRSSELGSKAIPETRPGEKQEGGLFTD